MNASFKKQGGGQYQKEDLIKLSTDEKVEVAKPSLETFETMVEKHGKRRKKKNGK